MGGSSPRLVRPRWETPDPPGVTGSYGPAVRSYVQRELGKTYGPWQVYSTDRMLRHDSNGDLLARIILLGTGRQNGKTLDVEGLWTWLLDEGRHLPPFRGWTEMLAAAHDAPQARKMYNRVRSGIDDSPALSERIKTTEWRGIKSGPITFDTVTGQPGSSRGATPGGIAWDEVLTQKDFEMWAALGPSQSAQRSPIMLLTSTAGTIESVLLRSFFDRLKRIASGDEKPDPHFYGAWWQSEDPDAAAGGPGTPITKGDWAQIRMANPALGDGRLTRQAIELDHSILPPDDWRRERLNHFVDVTVTGAFSPGVWARTRVSDALDGVDPPFALGVDIQPGWERATIVAAAQRPDGRLGAEVYKDLRAGEGDSLSARQIIDAIEAFPDPVSSVTYDSVSGAAAEFGRYATSAEAWATDWRSLKPHEVVAACMDVTEMILSGRLAVDDPLLDAQIPMTARRPVGQDGAFRFSRAHSGGPIDGIMALTLAVNGIVGTARTVPRIS